MLFGNLFLFIMLSFNLFAKPPKLKELISKQSMKNLRFVSRDGKITYYQSSKGILFMSTNYAANEVIKSKPNTTYHLFSGPMRKRLLISQDEHFFDANSLNHESKISVIDYGNYKIKNIGNGVNPKLQLNESWVSFYNTQNKYIKFINLVQDEFNFEFQTHNNINHYFRPDVYMLDTSKILYTDVTDKGHQVLSLFSRGTDKSEVIYTTSIPGQKIELCECKGVLYIGQFNLYDSAGETKIFKYDLKETQISQNKFNLVYSSSLNDLGQLTCDQDENKLYFIKSKKMFSKLIPYQESDLAILDESDPDGTNWLTYTGQVTQIIKMDQMIIIPHHDKYFLASGSYNAEVDNLPETEKETILKKLVDDIDKNKIKEIKKQSPSKEKK